MSRRIRRLLAMGVLGGGAAPIQYLLRDEFTTDASAPLTSPRTCEPGPGTLTITDAAGRVTISSGELVIGTGSGAVKAVYDNLVEIPMPFCALIDSKSPDPYFSLGVGANTDATQQYMRDYTNYVSFSTYGFQPYKILDNIATFVRGGIVKFSDHYIGIVDVGDKFRIIGATNNAVSPRYIVVASVSATAKSILDNLRVFSLGNSALYSVAQVNVADSEEFTSEANFCMTWTHVAQNGVVQDVMFRRIDDDNTMILRFTQATGKIAIYKKVLGVETMIGAEVSKTQVAGNSYTMSLTCIGSLITCFDIGSRTDATNQTSTGLKFSHASANLKIFPEYVPTSSRLNELV